MNSFYQVQNKSFVFILATASLLSGIVGISSSANAAQLESTPVSTVNSQTIAQASNCPSYAGGGRLEAYFETKNFHIYICNKRGSLFYTGISKSTRKAIRSLPTSSEEGVGYVARNNNYEYAVNGASLEILKNNRVIQTERVIRYVSGY
ncbi:hypothetical protein H6G80_15945 [Nostoc sp. FACHB-87]|uniref:hypothetical protein n=1 Tax=Nostocales TaxID=1161 RepID=UPI0016846B92|nr:MULTISPECIES: hypothetical protein [Nostocales]MBD2455567.1 hypothetical protein [Nostoc sp. FACHB-87]MBD2477423.1 hypothetical protein [Anabaena sp. FACHB-83]MBD2487733.1 hypothetical protein [Aulosira sp. FACHB-615]